MLLSRFTAITPLVTLASRDQGSRRIKKKALLPGILNLHITVGFKMFNGIQDSVCDDIFESAFIYIFIFL